MNFGVGLPACDKTSSQMFQSVFDVPDSSQVWDGVAYKVSIRLRIVRVELFLLSENKVTAREIMPCSTDSTAELGTKSPLTIRWLSVVVSTFSSYNTKPLMILTGLQALTGRDLVYRLVDLFYGSFQIGEMLVQILDNDKSLLLLQIKEKILEKLKGIIWKWKGPEIFLHIWNAYWTTSTT